MTDKIMVGKLQGCRVCDVIPDHYEYLIWADKQGLLKFKGIVLETIKEHAGFKDQRRHYFEEVVPWEKEDYDVDEVYQWDKEDWDVPF